MQFQTNNPLLNNYSVAVINLNILKANTVQVNQNTYDQNLLTVPQYTYQDLKLDLLVGNGVGTRPTTPINDLTDIKVNYDYAAVADSIENLLNSSPGEWLLNPTLGIGLPRFLFQPINQYTGEQIAQAIIQNLTVYETRCSIQKLQVQGDPDNNQYNIVLVLQIANISTSVQTLKGVLTSNSFKLIT